MSTKTNGNGMICALLGTLLLHAVSGTVAGADGTVQLTVVDKTTGQPIACRMHLRQGSEDGKVRKVAGLSFWHDHVVFPGQVTLELPRGRYFFTIEHGPEYTWNTGHFEIEKNSQGAETVELLRGVDMAAQGWFAGDLDVRRPWAEMALLMKAEELNVAQILTWDAYDGKLASGVPDESPVSVGDRFLCQSTGGQIRHPGGTLGIYGLPAPLPPSRSSGEFPPLSEVTASVREAGDAWIDLASPASWDLPLLAAHGGLDSVRVVGEAFCRDGVTDSETGLKPRDKMRYPGLDGCAMWWQDIYFRLLDCGLRLPPTAASLSGSAANPVGYNRVYVFLEEPFSAEAWWAGLRAGRVTAGNGPLLQPWVQGKRPGHVFRSPQGTPLELEPVVSLSYRGQEPIRYVEVVRNGQVASTLKLEEYAERQGKLLPLKFDQSGWFLIRAVSEVRNNYRFTITGPYYVEIGGKPRVSRQSAQFFLDWVYERARQIQLLDAQEQDRVIAAHRQARDFWQSRVDQANAE
ncbi:MAG: CehA/McbA family metallohydrolase domain-containing protein [Thermoguttaceae bacterium]